MNASQEHHQRLLDLVKQQEAALQPDHFDAGDAWRLGLILRDLALETGADIAVHISLFGAQVFHCGIGQPKPNFDRWIARKQRGTLECWKSSLRLKLESLTGGDQLADHGFDPADVVFCGGCFPLRLKSLGVVGAVTVSGLSDLQDHQLAVDALAQYMQTAVPKLPVG